METKFNCPHCNARVEATADRAGMAGDCPACGELLIVPSAQAPRAAPSVPPVPQSLTPIRSTPPQPTKSAEDYAAAAICATAKGAWKATKVVAPILGRIAAKVVGRAATAAAPHAEKAAIKTLNAVKPADAGSAVRLVIGKLLGWW